MWLNEMDGHMKEGKKKNDRLSRKKNLRLFCVGERKKEFFFFISAK